MAIEEVPLRQIAKDTVYTFTYSGNLGVEETKPRLYNDTNAPRVIKKVRASVGETASGVAGVLGGGVVIDIHKNGVSIFDESLSVLSEGVAFRRRLFIPSGEYTDISTPLDGIIWQEGEYLTVSIDQIGTVFPGADLTINVVVSE